MRFTTKQNQVQRNSTVRKKSTQTIQGNSDDARFGLQALLFGVVFMFVSISGVSGQESEWFRQFGSSGIDRAYGISSDGTGVYVAGETWGALPGQSSSGERDAFVQKYDSDGNEVWTRQFGTSSDDSAASISVDSTGVYVAGNIFWGALPDQISSGEWDVFVRKYDSDGSEVWTRQFGSSSRDIAFDISADDTGVYVTGYTYSTLPGQTSFGHFDAFVRKYDTAGNEVWTRQFGSSSRDIAFDISVDSSNVYVAGETYATLPSQTSSGGTDAFVRKYDVNGDEVWTRQFGSSSGDHAYGISVDDTGVYVAGETYATLPGQTNSGHVDAFVRKYDADGNEVWTRQFGSSNHDRAWAISAAGTGVHVAGYTYVLPGQTSSGGSDAFVRKYDADGNEVWTRQFGTSGDDHVRGISADATAVYVAGETDGTFSGQTSSGGLDAFIAKILPPVTYAIDQLIAVVESMNLQQGLDNSLDAKLQAAKDALNAANAGNRNDAINKLEAFINAVKAQRGKELTDAQADQLVNQANDIILRLGGVPAAPTLAQHPPSEGELAQNYPNPFNPETWIPYVLATDAPVTIRIYNVQGQLVRQLDIGHKPAGMYLDKANAAYWDGRDALGQRVGSGLYWYQITAGHFTATRRMVVVK